MTQPDNLDTLFDANPDTSTGGVADPLEALFTVIEAEEAEARTTGAALVREAGADLLEALAEAGGTALVEDLLAAGHSPAAVAALATQGSDKRVKPRVALGSIGGHRVVWLRSAGWQSVGQVNRREAGPTTKSLRHRLAAPNLAKSLARLETSPEGRGLLIEGQQDIELRETVRVAVQGLKGGGRGQDDPEAGALAAGVFPDLLVVENWSPARVGDRERYWPTVGGYRPVGGSGGVQRDREPDHIVAVEIELSGKSNLMMSAKIRHHDGAMRLGWWHAVVWITDDQRTTTRLAHAGVDDRVAHPGHYVMSTAACALGPISPDLGLPAHLEPWWVKGWASVPR